MSEPFIRAVIGRGFGDEGKGLATDYFCSLIPESLVVRHNGGAQSGHTVVHGDKRFVFHQLSSGSFRRADTYWGGSFFPDLYKLGEEAEGFRTVAGFVPGIFSDPESPCVTIDDVLVNMMLEESRGAARHGSCGMGINEADLRTAAGFALTVGEVLSSGSEGLYRRLCGIRRDYVMQRLERLGLGACIGTAENSRLCEYADLLSSDVVLKNAAEQMVYCAHKYVQVLEPELEFVRRNGIVFESGQGLLLDSENTEYAPNVTASRTGLTNPVHLLNRLGLSLNEAVYVSRTYVTRHGAGKLRWECPRDELGGVQFDLTNIHNPWQGSIRYARHGSAEEFLAPVRADISMNLLPDSGTKVSLMLTHLNETDGCVCLCAADGCAMDIPVADFLQLRNVSGFFDRVYTSWAEDSVQ